MKNLFKVFTNMSNRFRKKKIKQKHLHRAGNKKPEQECRIEMLYLLMLI